MSPGDQDLTSRPDDELALVTRLREGDEAAFAALVERYHTRLVRLARSFVKDDATAQEVAQESWLGLVRGIDRFEGRSSLKTWLFRIVANKAKTRGTREARSTRLEDHELETLEPAVAPDRFGSGGRWAAPPTRWEDDTPEAFLLRGEVQRHLQAALEALPPRQRRVLVLRDVEGVSSEEVCNILEVSETNQRVLLHRARSSLHQALERYLDQE